MAYSVQSFTKSVIFAWLVRYAPLMVFLIFFLPALQFARDCWWLYYAFTDNLTWDRAQHTLDLPPIYDIDREALVAGIVLAFIWSWFLTRTSDWRRRLAWFIFLINVMIGWMIHPKLLLSVFDYQLIWNTPAKTQQCHGWEFSIEDVGNEFHSGFSFYCLGITRSVK